MARPRPLQMFGLANSSPSSSATSSSPGVGPTPAPTPSIPGALSATPSSAHLTTAAASNPANPSYIQRHFRKRLLGSKAACDAELRKVIHAVTAYVEHSLRAQQEAEWAEEEARERERENAMLTADSTSDDAGDESDAEPGGGSTSGRRKIAAQHRHRKSFILTSGAKLPSMGMSSALAIPGTSATHVQHTHSSSSSGSKQLSVSSSPTSTFNRTSGNPLTRRLSRTYTLSPPILSPPIMASTPFMSPPPPDSSSSSRSNSRSRSPLPPPTARAPSPSISFRSPPTGPPSPSTTSPPTDPSAPSTTKPDFISTLRDLITLSTSLLDMPASALTAPTAPRSVSGLVQAVQALGRAWDLQPEWHGRGWYVQVLLAVAGLSRVVEWWQAEKEFWHFGEDGEDADDEGEVEGMTFVLKPAEEQETDVHEGSAEDELEQDLDRAEREGTVMPEREGTVMPDDRPHAPPSAPSPARERKDPLAGAVQVPRAPTPLNTLPRMETAMGMGVELGVAAVVGGGDVGKAKATEEVRALAEHAQTEQILMVLGMDGERILWVSPSWEKIVGSNPEDVYGTNITPLLASTDAQVFIDATRRFETDESHTLEAKFLLLVRPDPNSRAHYIEMEGKGMLVKDRLDSAPSHTLWLVRPSTDPTSRARVANEDIYPQNEAEGVPATPDTAPLPLSASEQEVIQELELDSPATPFHARGAAVPITPFPFERPISTKLILCRICECQVPDWFFEKHNETCNEVHGLEADIAECDESLQELMSTIAAMSATLDRQGQASPGPAGQGGQAAAKEAPPEYRGTPVLTPASAPASPVLRTSASARLQRVALRKRQRALLDNLSEVLQLAREIEMPAVREEEADGSVPLEREPFLPPGSERRVALVERWTRPVTDDPALAQLVQDAETLMRTKVEYVNRMRNTLMYSEKVRREWEDKVEQTLQEMESLAVEDDDEQSDSGGSEKSVYEHSMMQPTEQPTPVAPTSVAPSPLPDQDPPTSLLSNVSPPPMQGILFGPHMCPPTPGSASSSPHPHFASPPLLPSSPFSPSPLASSPIIPSPLAITAPLVGPHDTAEPDPVSVPAPSSSSAPSSAMQTTFAVPPPRTSRSRRSTQSLLPEPRLVVTPPLSPMVSPRDAVLSNSSQRSVQSHSRRPSMAQPFSPSNSNIPLSPRIPSIAPASKTGPSSIRDFEIIKPISKGAFGSVYLAKKKSTGDYYAIKVLKKSDMIAKNQVTNVKAERTILMQQADSPFVVKLYFTFQNKDYLYLVMEYLNGGDCAALIKTIGALPEDWTRTYVSEVILGLENIHARGIVHRDLKPDNLLIDSRGHLKMTDFGLSRIGLFGRQTRDGRNYPLRRGSTATRVRVNRSGMPSRPPSVDSTMLTSNSDATPDVASSFGQSYFSQYGSGGTPLLSGLQDDVSESSGSESISGLFFTRASRASGSPQQSFASELTSDLRSYHLPGGTPPAGEQKFVGTPDYLAPETILATSEDDRAVDWWALGVVTYEFLYGFPPFHADSPAQVFDNIISRRIEWHREYVDYSPAARDFMDRLLCIDPTKRLGFNGAAEVKAHPWLRSINWDKITNQPAQFVPQVTDPESTDYFDPRGAVHQLFYDDEPDAAGPSADSSPKADKLALRPGSTHPSEESSGLSPAMDDFGTFSFKNLPVLKQANDEVIRKLKAESPLQLVPMHDRRRSLSQRTKNRQSIVTTLDPKFTSTNPPSPSTSTSSMASTPSRGSFPPSTPGSAVGHGRRPSEHGVLDRFKTQFEGEISRRNTLPSRLRTASVSSVVSSSVEQGSGPEGWQGHEVGTSPSSVQSAEMRRPSDPVVDRTVVCLLAEDNIISQKVQEVILTRMGCRCVLVADGYEAILAACGDIKFDCILMDYQMPTIDGEIATKFIKSTNNKNTSTPVIAVSAYTAQEPGANSNLFAASLSKPVQRADLLTVMRKLGFKITTQDGGSKHPHKVVAK